MRIPTPRSAAPVLLLTTALVVTAGGGAVAGTLITGKQIKDSTITTKDVKNRTLTAKDLSPKTVAGLRGAAGAPGQAGAPGLVKAYARVSGASVSHQSGGITSSTGVAGITCVVVPGRRSTTTPAVVTLDYASDSTSGINQAYAEVRSDGAGCDPDQFSVVTFRRDAATGAQTFTYEPFFILVP